MLTNTYQLAHGTGSLQQVPIPLVLQEKKSQLNIFWTNKPSTHTSLWCQKIKQVNMNIVLSGQRRSVCDGVGAIAVVLHIHFHFAGDGWHLVEVQIRYNRFHSNPNQKHKNKKVLSTGKLPWLATRYSPELVSSHFFEFFILISCKDSKRCRLTSKQRNFFHRIFALNHTVSESHAVNRVNKGTFDDYKN